MTTGIHTAWLMPTLPWFELVVHVFFDSFQHSDDHGNPGEEVHDISPYLVAGYRNINRDSLRQPDCGHAENVSLIRNRGTSDRPPSGQPEHEGSGCMGVSYGRRRSACCSMSNMAGARSGRLWMVRVGMPNGDRSHSRLLS